MSANEFKHAGLNLGGADGLTHEKAASAIFGFWLFLMSDAVIFALLFATYGVMLPATVSGPTPANEYKILPVFLETLILLTSSFTFGMASVAMKHEASCRQLIGWMSGDAGSRGSPFSAWSCTTSRRCSTMAPIRPAAGFFRPSSRWRHCTGFTSFSEASG